jgi:hypothetical protein
MIVKSARGPAARSASASRRIADDSCTRSELGV